MNTPGNVVVVGASVAGLTAAVTLRTLGYDGRLTLIGDEPHTPYNRPPLSKQILAGTWEPDRIKLRTDEELSDLDARLLFGRSAIGLDTAARRVVLEGGDSVSYDALVIATGVTPNSLPGAHHLAGVHLLRTLDDALALRADLRHKPDVKVAVVGAGFLGSEAAAAARRMRLDVTMIDPRPVPMRRQFGDRIAGLVGRLHTKNGVSMRCGTGVRRFFESGGRVTGLELTDGTLLDADVVVVAIGAAPAIGWLAGSGLELGNGVECDPTCRAAPGVYAAGDVASWHNDHFGCRMRLEHRLNATEQAQAVARNVLGEGQPFAPVPYFWTDQYDAHIQAYGIFPGDAELAVLHGELEGGHFVVAYGHRGVVVGVLGWNSPCELRKLRQLVVDRAPWTSILPTPRAVWPGRHLSASLR
ncbi:NAD(P)/FAD-dependent oxidoreductase [Streptomyces sp. PSAA01]|uniref:NAD(P)/FAD-dependent oxidoreductase n=1 Tax=Streptomyces sp. PSAA01 TaxID=2912762 RepID=UPI001F3385FF|nr:FAD-dependent oxidoreductase [Streptomyces sp. PSAA01]MCG0284222.1 FAD-dependent oxidoreductase [Streptomyces sp. PSAA01]